MTNDYRPELARGCLRELAREEGTEEEAPSAAPWGEPRELTMSVPDEREASENN